MCIISAPKHFFSSANQDDELDEGPINDGDAISLRQEDNDDNDQATNGVSKNVPHQSKVNNFVMIGQCSFSLISV